MIHMLVLFILTSTGDGSLAVKVKPITPMQGPVALCDSAGKDLERKYNSFHSQDVAKHYCLLIPTKPQ